MGFPGHSGSSPGGDLPGLLICFLSLKVIHSCGRSLHFPERTSPGYSAPSFLPLGMPPALSIASFTPGFWSPSLSRLHKTAHLPITCIFFHSTLLFSPICYHLSYSICICLLFFSCTKSLMRISIFFFNNLIFSTWNCFSL